MFVFHRLSHCILRFWTTIQVRRHQSERFEIVSVYINKAITSDRKIATNYKLLTEKKKVKPQTQTTRKQDRAPSHLNSSNTEPSKNSSASSGSKTTKEEDNREHVLILGDSIVKHILKDGELAAVPKLNHLWSRSLKVIIAISDCYDYFKPPLNSNPDDWQKRSEDQICKKYSRRLSWRFATTRRSCREAKLQKLTRSWRNSVINITDN